jgi:hypothetical protein
LGETFREWLVAEKLDSPEANCQAREQALRDWQSANKVTGYGSLREAEGTREECLQETAKVNSGQAGKIIVDEFGEWYKGKEYSWQFSDGKLLKVLISIPGNISSNKEPDTDQEIKFLIEAYGAPIDRRTVSYQNAYGAKWDCPEVTWSMPDGSMILASEHIRSTDNGPLRGLQITFASKESLEFKKQPEKNPYIH